MEFKRDTGWAWIVAVASAISITILGINRSAGGIIHMYLLQTYPISVTKSALIVAVSSGMVTTPAPLAGVVISRFNCRLCQVFGGFLYTIGLAGGYFAVHADILLVTYGVIAGLGGCFCLTATLVSLGYYFEKYQNVVTSLCMGGFGLGLMCGPVIYTFLIEYYGLRGAFLLAAAMTAHLSLAGMFMRPSKFETREYRMQMSRQTNIDGKQKRIKDLAREIAILFSDKPFMLFACSVFLWTSSFSTIMTHEANYSMHVGIGSENIATSLVVIFGMGNTISRYIIGMATSKNALWEERMLVQAGLNALAGTITAMFPLFGHSFIGHVVFCATVGFYTGGLCSTYPGLVHDLVGVDIYATAIAIVLSLVGLSSVIGPVIFGVIADSGGSYDIGFHSMASFRKKYLFAHPLTQS